MEALGWHDLAMMIHGRLQPSRAWGRCTRIATDSRSVQAGDVFWALPGERFDGHDFIANAIAAGASLIVCERIPAGITTPCIVVANALTAFGDLARALRRRSEALIIGVTGSVGKTTTKELLHAALSAQFSGLRSPGNFNNLVGLPKTLLDLAMSHEFAVLEMGASRAGDIAALAAIAEPEIGVVTAIGTSHLQSFGSIEAIVRTKGELIAALPASGLAVLPGDDPQMAALAERAACRVVTAGLGPHNDVTPHDVRTTATDASFSVDGQPYAVQLPGADLLSNVLCAIAVAREIGVPPELIAEGLEDFRPLAGRGAVEAIGPWMAIDDTYNASPLSVTAACRRLAQFSKSPTGRRWAVLGDMRELGSQAEAEHHKIGRLVASLPLDGMIAFGEHAHATVAGAIAGGWNHRQLAVCESLPVVTMVLDCWLDDGDVVLVKGSRAMQMERVLAWMRERAMAGDLRRCA